MDRQSNTAVILIGHGSRRETYNSDIENMINYLKEKISSPIYLTYNEFAKPDWRSLLNNVVREGYRRIVIGLVFLGRGNHVFRDIMGELGIQRLNSWVVSKISGKEVELYVTEPLSSSPLIGLALYYRLARALNALPTLEYTEDPYEIEESSMNLILSNLDVKDEREKRIIGKAIFASGNPELARYLKLTNLDAGIEAIKAGSEIVADVKMVSVGIRWRKVTCMIDNERTKELSKELGITRAAAAMRLSIGQGGKVVVIGNAPTALMETIKLVKEGIDIPFIVATPPGFTNAKESKEALIETKIPSVVLTGTYGGSGIAVAIINEIIKMAMEG
ncbi:PRK05782 family protein [Saccharolobus solfataricus]|uniref:PRK05782 family protein n=3 Tax=Saccharolobus solfataricus TaxID=2287 RepID=A0A0E3M9B1_SACSO|nr:precorrin-8X methylmutase [Saccharolobus solfataricus]AAK42464.1 Cobalamin biosynthesis precorrin isomerase, putative (cbiC) [Saccharolobus solfataricus P2]AKA72565.1 PRK05782 family protein [Saccharolobus solfataricus]AKA75264.1 PRK05782 family protein [Saccharolobus solfataricus]AKA77957.1 PRK05782 family protein [Saccharolobus solfataricus]AZF67074.1 PRK05782 family protein [Saccharolobus solfataricus]